MFGQTRERDEDGDADEDEDGENVCTINQKKFGLVLCGQAQLLHPKSSADQQLVSTLLIFYHSQIRIG